MPLKLFKWKKLRKENHFLTEQLSTHTLATCDEGAQVNISGDYDDLINHDAMSFQW